MDWAVVGRLYVRTVTTVNGEVTRSLYFVTNRGGGHIQVIARVDEQADREFPIRYADESCISFDETRVSTTLFGSKILNWPVTVGEVEECMKLWVTGDLKFPKDLPLQRWVALGLRAEESRLLLNVWQHRVWHRQLKATLLPKIRWGKEFARLQTKRLGAVLGGKCAFPFRVDTCEPWVNVVKHPPLPCFMCFACGPI